MRTPPYPTFPVARWLVVLVLVSLAGACATTGFPLDRAARPADDVPAGFLVVTPEGLQPPDASSGACRNPMEDPRDETRLRLERSAEGLGDYAVPAGRYGVGAGELLRLDCRTGRVVGIVKR